MQQKTLVNTPPTLEELPLEQALETYCQAASLNVNQAGYEFCIDQQELLGRKSIINETMQIVALASLRAQILSLAYHLSNMLQPGQRRMYVFLTSTYFWPHIASNVYATIAKCQSYVHNGS